MVTAAMLGLPLQEVVGTAELYCATGYNDLNWMRSVWFSPSDDDADGDSRHELPRTPRSARVSALDVIRGTLLTVSAA